MSDKTDVLYNDTCPICSREVGHYERLTQKAGVAVAYDPLDQTDTQADWGVDADTAAKRLHVRKDGQIYSGIPAFVVLWREIPQYRWLARLISLPGIHALAPVLFKMHRRRMQRKRVNQT
jgi:predicted DCC family thiol-disulfide oxidoreductase YuxK